MTVTPADDDKNSNEDESHIDEVVQSSGVEHIEVDATQAQEEAHGELSIDDLSAMLDVGNAAIYFNGVSSHKYPNVQMTVEENAEFISELTKVANALYGSSETQ